MSFFGAISDTASNLWSSASNLFGGAEEEEGPISVPVTPEMEETARAMNQRADDWAAAGHTKSPYEEKREQQEKDMHARDAGFRDSRDQQEFRDGSAAWSQALDLYLAGKGPSPGPRNEFIQQMYQGQY